MLVGGQLQDGGLDLQASAGGGQLQDGGLDLQVRAEGGQLELQASGGSYLVSALQPEKRREIDSSCVF